jgi:transposase InsO family protein
MMTNRVAPNLLNRTFRAHGPRAVLLTDITYIPRRKVVADGPDKFTYLCVIMDAYTKEVLAYTLSVSLEVDFVLATVNMLMEKHGSELKTDALIHSDQGCHYTSSKFIDIVGSSRLRQSMSHKGNCWDNAPQESLFGHMKADVKLNPSYGHAEIARVVDDWMDYYNNDRYQWGLAKLAPCEFYRYIATGEYPLPFNPPPIVIPDGINLEGDDDVDFDEESNKPS